MTKTLCIYHASCADGLGAAWAVHRALGSDVEFVAAKYGEDPPFSYRVPKNARLPSEVVGLNYAALRNRDILIVDFSYPLPILRAMATEARSVLVIDHHATAKADLAELPTATNWDPARPTLTVYGNLAAIFDLERSGASLTWDYLHPLPSVNAYRSVAEAEVIRRPRIIDLIEDRDLWRFRFGDETRAFHAVLTSYAIGDLPAMFERLDKWNEWQHDYADYGLISPWENILDEGSAILRAHTAAVASAVAAFCRTIRIAGHVVPCANVPNSMASDAGHLMCEDILKKAKEMDVEPLFSATYYDGADGKRHFSLRSPEGGADVGQIAKAMAERLNEQHKITINVVIPPFAGGGHEHAAGFDAPLSWSGE